MVVCHDLNLKRVAGVDRRLGTMTYDQVSRLDVDVYKRQHTEFAVLSGFCDQPVIFIQQEYCFVGKGYSDGNGGCLLYTSRCV